MSGLVNPIGLSRGLYAVGWEAWDSLCREYLVPCHHSSEGLEAFGLCHAGDVLFVRFPIHLLSRRIISFKSWNFDFPSPTLSLLCGIWPWLLMIVLFVWIWGLLVHSVNKVYNKSHPHGSGLAANIRMWTHNSRIQGHWEQVFLAVPLMIDASFPSRDIFW